MDSVLAPTMLLTTPSVGERGGWRGGTGEGKRDGGKREGGRGRPLVQGCLAHAQEPLPRTIQEANA